MKLMCLKCDLQMDQKKDSWSGMTWYKCEKCESKITIIIK